LTRESGRARKYSMQTKREGQHVKYLRSELNNLRDHLRLTRMADRHLLLHEKQLKAKLQHLKNNIRHYKHAFRLEKRNFKARLEGEHRGFEARRHSNQQSLRRLMVKLEVDKTHLAHVEKEKFATFHARDKLLRLLNVQRQWRSQQIRRLKALKGEFHTALAKERFVEKELKKQMKFSRHLKRVLACGRWRILSSKQERFSRLLKQEGFKLRMLFTKLRLVDDKVHKLMEMLRKVAFERKKGEERLQRELVEAAHHAAAP